MDLDTVLYLAQDAILGIMVVVMIALTAVGAMSYIRTRARKILLVTVALGTLAAKAGFITALLYMDLIETTGLGVIFIDTILVLDLIAACCLYVAIFRY